MIRAISPPSVNRSVRPLPVIGLLLFISTTLYYFYQTTCQANAPVIVYATATTPSGLTFDYDVTTFDLSVDWANGGDFDPRDKCPTDFFSAGFRVLCRQMVDGGYFRFLYHKGKRLLYRIDEDVINGQARIGLHWVEGTSFGARYRIADPAFKGGKTVAVPNGRGGTDAMRFTYGEAVSKKRVQRRRELFRETHIDPQQCPEWWDVLDFLP